MKSLSLFPRINKVIRTDRLRRSFISISPSQAVWLRLISKVAVPYTLKILEGD